MEMFWIIILILACIVIILGFSVTIKKCHSLKKENDRLREMIRKFETGSSTKEQKLQEYESIISKIKTRFNNSKNR